MVGAAEIEEIISLDQTWGSLFGCRAGDNVSESRGGAAMAYLHTSDRKLVTTVGSDVKDNV